MRSIAKLKVDRLIFFFYFPFHGRSSFHSNVRGGVDKKLEGNSKIVQIIRIDA